MTRDGGDVMLRVLVLVARAAELAAAGLFVAAVVGVWLSFWPAGCLLAAAGLVGLSWAVSRGVSR